MLGSRGGGWDRAVQLEQKSVDWMKHIVAKFSKGRQLVSDQCVGTLSVAKACVKLPNDRWTVGLGIDAL